MSRYPCVNGNCERAFGDEGCDYPGCIDSAPRAMTLADIVPAWVWAYHGHVLPNGEVVFFPQQTNPLWHSNDPTWHGV